MKNKPAIWILVLLTPIFFLLTHAIAYLFHEYCHSFCAWILGYKQNPFALHYGHLILVNILTLSQVSEAVNYLPIEAVHPWLAALVAFAGPGIGNFSLFIFSLIALRSRLAKHYIWYYFFFWLLVMNLGNFIDYVPSRTFALRGDIHEIVSELGISPWWIMIIFGYPVFYATYQFYRRVLPNVYLRLKLNYILRIILLILVSITLFVLFGGTGRHAIFGATANFTAWLLIYSCPLVIAIFWPKKD